MYTVSTMSIACFRQLAQLLTAESAVLATVIKVQGSVPREIGAKMIVASNQRIFFTIGGGAGEAKVMQGAQQVLDTGQKQSVTIDLTGSTQRQTEGVCGGQMEVWLERWSGESAIALIDQVLEKLQTGQEAILVTPLTQQSSPYLSESLDNLPHPQATFVERLEPPPTLLIIGAGHVGEQLAKVAHTIGFEIVIHDDRADWANRQKYPQAQWILTEPIALALDKLASHSQLYVAMVTRGYAYDLEALETLLKRSINCRYLGMIGSEKRVKKVYQSLIKSGFTKSQLAAIYAPIGLDIEALTPEEIAISIGAELIMVRRGGTGLPLSTNLREMLFQPTLSMTVSEIDPDIDPDGSPDRGK